MQHQDSTSLAARSPAAAKKTALAAFDAALINPHATDWQALSFMLHGALTAKRAAKADDAAEAPGFLPWYAPDRETYKAASTTRPLIDFVFSDGVTVAATAYQKDGKPINIAKACRIAFDLHRAKVRNRLHVAFPEAGIARLHSADSMGCNSPLTVPAIVSATYRETGETWNPDTLNRETEGDRVRILDGVAMLEAEDMEAAAVTVRMAFQPARDRSLTTAPNEMRRHASEAANRVARVLDAPFVYRSFTDVDSLREIVAADLEAYPWDAAHAADAGYRASVEADWLDLAAKVSDDEAKQAEIAAARRALADAVFGREPIEAIEPAAADAPQSPTDAPSASSDAPACDNDAPETDDETCPVIRLATGRCDAATRSAMADDANRAFRDADHLDAPSAQPSGSVVRLMALASTAGVPIARDPLAYLMKRPAVAICLAA